MMNNIALLLLRISVSAIMIVAHGLGKLQDPGPFVDNVARMGFPLPGAAAYLSISAETVFPLLVILGLFTRVSALIAGLNMFIAGFVVHMVMNGDPFPKMEKAVLYMIVFFFIALAGPGSYTVKRIFGGR